MREVLRQRRVLAVATPSSLSGRLVARLVLSVLLLSSCLSCAGTTVVLPVPKVLAEPPGQTVQLLARVVLPVTDAEQRELEDRLNPNVTSPVEVNLSPLGGPDN